MTSLVFDVGLVLVVAANAWFGMRRGFVLGMLDLLGWLAALVLAEWASDPLAVALAQMAHLPRGVADLAAMLAILIMALAVATLGTWLVYQRLVAPRLLGVPGRLDRALGLVPGAADGVVLASLALAFLLATSISGSINQSVMSSQLARPVAIVAMQAGGPFERAAQAAALDINSYLTKRFGAQATRLTLPVTDMATDTEAEKQMLELLNAERTKRGLVSLVLDARLTQIARQHSTEMLQQHYFAHDSPSLGSPFDRMARAGIRYRVAGENLALAPNVDRAHEGLMNSPEHRDNILRPEFRKVGIGAVSGGLSGVMFTQDFTD